MFAVEHVCGGYLATESSRDASCCVGSLNNNKITVKECVQDRRFKSQSANIYHGACGLKSAIQGCAWQLNKREFPSMAEVSFPSREI